MRGFPSIKGWLPTALIFLLLVAGSLLFLRQHWNGALDELKDALIYSQIDKPDSSMTCENWRTDS